jgi:hypothetical protein
VFSRIQFKAFRKRWSVLLQKYRIPEPLHMADFVRPNGQHVGIGKEMKLSLFRDASKLINSHKLYSFSISIPLADFNALMTKDMRKMISGPYSFAFFSAVLFNSSVAEKKGFDERVAYLVDRGCAHPEQIIDTHAVIQKTELKSGKRSHTGGLDWGSDDLVQALQAADLIVWSARRRETGDLGNEFEPLNEALREGKPPHCHVPIPAEGIKMLAEPIYKRIAKYGSLPRLSDIIRP